MKKVEKFNRACDYRQFDNLANTASERYIIGITEGAFKTVGRFYLRFRPSSTGVCCRAALSLWGDCAGAPFGDGTVGRSIITSVTLGGYGYDQRGDAFLQCMENIREVNNSLRDIWNWATIRAGSESRLGCLGLTGLASVFFPEKEGWYFIQA